MIKMTFVNFHAIFIRMWDNVVIKWENRIKKNTLQFNLINHEYLIFVVYVQLTKNIFSVFDLLVKKLYGKFEYL